MTQYNLNYSGSDVDLAIEKSLAHLNNIDTTPNSPSTKAVTSEGIKAALDTKLAIADIAANLNSPSSTTTPSTQAVVDALRPKVAKYTINTLDNYNPPDNGTIELDMTESSDVYGLASLSGSDRIIIAEAGSYYISYNGEFKAPGGAAGSSSSVVDFRFEIDGFVYLDDEHRNTNSYRRTSGMFYVQLGAGDMIRLTATNHGGSYGDNVRLYVRNTTILVNKVL